MDGTVSYKFTKKELLSLEWRFKDKALGIGGRNQAYYDDVDDWGDISAEGLGIDPALMKSLRPRALSPLALAQGSA